VAILARAEFGLFESHGFSSAEHRGLSATFQYPGSPDIKLVSVYLESGSPLQGPSALMIGQICSSLRTWGKEFIIGGAFNCLPVTFLRANLTDSINAQVVAPTGVGGTCKGQKGRTRVIDYFCVSSSLVSAVQGVAIIPKAGISPIPSQRRFCT